MEKGGGTARLPNADFSAGGNKTSHGENFEKIEKIENFERGEIEIKVPPNFLRSGVEDGYTIEPLTGWCGDSCALVASERPR